MRFEAEHNSLCFLFSHSLRALPRYTLEVRTMNSGLRAYVSLIRQC
jgi:hypothetical protein